MVMPRRDGASLWPWKLAMVLLYAEIPAVERLAPGSLLIHTAQLALHLKIKPTRLRPYLERLADLGVISSLTFRHGYVTIRLVPPIGYSPAGVIDVQGVVRG